MGPLLFLLYVNDIGNCIHNCNLRLFADDTNVFTHGRNLNTLVEETNICLDKLNTWFLANKLNLNVDKTCYIIFAPFKNIVLSDHKLQLNINNVILQQLRSCKYLGVMFDEELSWKPHIYFNLKKIIKFTSIFYKLRSILPNDCIKQIYYALVHPHLLYGIEVYENTFNSYIDPLLKLNNKILRILQKSSRLTPINS